MLNLKRASLCLFLCAVVTMSGNPWLIGQGQLAHSTSLPSTASLPEYTVSQGSLFRNGVEIQLHGVNWFGFETANHTTHGLSERNLDDMVNQMQEIGINAVRLPLCPASLHNASVSGINYSLNPDLAHLDSNGVLGMILGTLNKHGMYALLDHHTSDCKTISPLWYTRTYSETDWISDLTVMAQLSNRFPNVIGIDLKNEPHDIATWGTSHVETDWNSAAERAGQAVLKTAPHLLVFIQGISDTATCSIQKGNWWGSNLEPVSCAPLNPAFLPTSKVVLSPHLFGPDLDTPYYFRDPHFPNNLPQVWEAQFGFASTLGYTVVPGEWGGRYGSEGGNPRDVAWQNAFVSYLISKGICSSFYWAWNPDSSDLGGILTHDWYTTWPGKVHLLNQYWNQCRTAH